MESDLAIDALSALAQATRLGAFRELVAHEPHGLAAGALASLLDVPQNTLSSHLAILERAGLAESERRGRQVVYRARVDAIRQLTSFLVSECCGGRPELCEPLVAEFTPCCQPGEGPGAC